MIEEIFFFIFWMKMVGKKVTGGFKYDLVYTALQ